jgi:hypothetical protein
VKPERLRQRPSKCEEILNRYVWFMCKCDYSIPMFNLKINIEGTMLIILRENKTYIKHYDRTDRYKG